ncbi:MAG: PAS domain S-box protein [Bacteroidota bacterium]|nr:PAS domain S-box protein [Bacteroidota bacterium]
MGPKIIRNINISWKFRLVAFGFLLPVIILLYMLVSEKNIAIDFASKELTGTVYLSDIRDLLKNLSEYRAHSSVKLNTGIPDNQIQLTAKGIDSSLRLLENDNVRFSKTLNLASHISGIKTEWENLKSKSFSAFFESSQEYDSLVKKIDLMISYAGDASNLILDPDLSSYYMMDAALIKIPAEFELLTQLESCCLQSGPDNSAGYNREFSQLIVLKGLIQSNSRAIRASILTGIRNNDNEPPDDRLIKTLNGFIDASGELMQVLNELSNAPISKPKRMEDKLNPEVVNISVKRSINSSMELWSSDISALKKLLEARITGLNERKFAALFGIGGLLMLTMLLFLFISKNIVSSVEILSDAADKVTHGDLSISVGINAKDELGILASNFNKMISELASHIQHRTEKLSQTEEALKIEKKEHRQAEEALNKSEMLFRRVWEISVDGMRLTDERGSIIMVNEAFCKAVEMKKDELEGKSFSIIYHPSLQWQNLLIYGDDISSRNIQPVFERESLLWNGKSIWFEFSNSLLELPGPERYVLSIVRDITERKIAEQKLRQSKEQLRDLASHLQSIREEERTMIAREIHDELGQVLTVLKIQISLLSNKLREDQKELKEKISSVSGLIDSTVESVQKISSQLRPGILDDLGLVPAIEWQAQDFQERTGILCGLNLFRDEISLDRNKSTAVFRIFQEALTNIARHSAADRVDITLRTEDNALLLEITDNGRGITPVQISDQKSLGLLGMKERALILGGTVQISGADKCGTTVSVFIPLDN